MVRPGMTDVERLTVKEYAQRFGYHVQTVYTAIRYKRFKYRIERDLGTRTIRIVVPRESINTHTDAHSH